MTEYDLNSLQDRLGLDLTAFLPELILCVGIVVLLLLRVLSASQRTHLGPVALTFTLLALFVAFLQWRGGNPLGTSADAGPHSALQDLAPITAPIAKAIDLFSGLLIYDGLTVYMRLFLLSSTALVIVLTMLTGIPDAEDSADFHCLLLGATLGMAIMASSNHLLMVFLGIEMASLPSYALAGFLKGKRQGSEASLKYVVYGGGASGIMLYGISLLAGRFGTAYLPALAAQCVTAVQTPSGSVDLPLLLGTLFVIIGIAFKLAAVPFHFWCPDVFEGAPAEVAGFLSVASKGAALALLARFVLVLGGLDNFTPIRPNVDWLAVVRYLVPTLALLAAVTATFGNLAAYLQTNVKRLLAYSTIAHAGYMIMGLAPLTSDGAAAVLFYLIAYLLMNVGAFAVVAFIRNQIGTEDLSGYRGLVRRSPGLVIALAVFLLSLLGLPPLAGFAAKFQIFRVLYEGGMHYGRIGEPGLANTLYALLVIGGLNTVISLVYYIKVLKIAILEAPLEEIEGEPSRPLGVPGRSVAYASVLALLILVVGIFWDPLAEASFRGLERFRPTAERVKKGDAVPDAGRRGGAAL
jgi:NADH-quinone oxidoreductase subunit N